MPDPKTVIKKDVAQIRIDISEEEHRKFKGICYTKGTTIKDCLSAIIRKVIADNE